MIGFKLIQYLQENKQINQDRMQLFDTDESKIKIQLLALGLIASQTAEATTGGVTEFVSLTPRGHQQLVELLAVRSAGFHPNSN